MRAFARRGKAALEAAAEQPPDIVVIDLGLPEKVQALDAGADDYVTKPFGMEEFLARLRAAVRRASVAADTE